MKIIIDNSNLIVGGGIQVGTSFLNDLNALNLNFKFHVIQSVNSAKAVDTSKFSSNFFFYDLNDKSAKSIWQRKKEVKNIEESIQPDVIFTVFGPSYHKSNFPKVVGFAIPFMIYKDSPFFSKICFIEKMKYKALAFIKKRAFLRNSNALVFETANAQQVFSKYTNKKHELYTVSNTLNEIFSKHDQWENLEIQNKSKFNIIYLTSNYPHKNIQIIPNVIDVLIEKYKLSDFKFLITVTREEVNFPVKYNQYVEYLGKVPLNKIPALYKQSHLAFIPTLLEVFSATYLEAMYMNLPIVASDMPFSRDICADAALFSKPTDAEDYAEAIYRLYMDVDLKNEKIKLGSENLKRFGTSMDRTMKYIKIIQNQKK